MIAMVVAAAAGSLLALGTYNKSARADPVRTEAVVTSVRQSVSVVLSIFEAIWSVLDALTSASRPNRVKRGRPAWAAALASDDDS